MRYYLLIFLLSTNSFAVDLSRVIDEKLNSIAKVKTFKEQKKNLLLLQDEIKKIKKVTKLSDSDFYLATDFNKVADSISMMTSNSSENCFNTQIEVMSNYGVRSVDMSEKELPVGAKKALEFFKILCSKKK